MQRNILGRLFKTLATGMLVLTYQAQSQALESPLSSVESSTYRAGYLLAQADTDDSYDPFADYSEFEESTEEEADINFFRNGRFFVLGFMFGQRMWTGNLAKLYTANSSFGIFFTYFFDLRLALQLGTQLGDYSFRFLSEDGLSATTGNVSFTFINFNLKYYLNTANVTKGLADLNPYFIGGFSQVYRTYTIPSIDGFGRDSTTGLDAGIGLEIPIMQRKAFVGGQLTYHMVYFKDRNSVIILPDGTRTQAVPSGDTYDIMFLLGFNF